MSDYYALLKRVELLQEALEQATRQLAEYPNPPEEVLLGLVFLDRDPDSDDYNRMVVYPVTGPDTEAYPISFDSYRRADIASLGRVLASEAQVYRDEHDADTPQELQD